MSTRDPRPDYAPRSLAARTAPHDLPEQFVLGPTVDVPPGWRSTSVTDLTLASHPTLPVLPVEAGGGEAAGWVVGYPISGTELLADGSTVTLPGSGPSRFDDLVDTLGGRFAAISLLEGGGRVYLDPCGSLSVVFSPRHRLVASTPGLIPYTEGTDDRRELIGRLGIPWTNAMYPLGMTPRVGIDRLLPNHSLDLGSWTAVRRWPTPGWEEDGEVEPLVQRVSRRLQDSLTAVTTADPCYLPLTAGRDSRMLLACARSRLSRIESYTLRLRDSTARRDARVARRLARRVGLAHRTVRVGRPDPDDLLEWAARTGASTGEVRGWRASTAYKTLDPARVHLLGNVGEIARGYYWNDEDAADQTLEPERLLGHCGAPATPETRSRAERWIAEAPTRNALRLLDLFYIEQRLGGWAGVFPYAEYRGPGYVLFPMNHREIVDAMIRLPTTVKREGTLPDRVIRHMWPELLELPFNEDVGVSRLASRLRRGVAKSPIGRLIRRARNP